MVLLSDCTPMRTDVHHFQTSNKPNNKRINDSKTQGKRLGAACTAAGGPTASLYERGSKHDKLAANG